MAFTYKTDDNLPRLWWHTLFTVAVVVLSIWKGAWGPKFAWGLIFVVALVIGTTTHRWMRYLKYQRVKSQPPTPDAPSESN